MKWAGNWEKGWEQGRQEVGGDRERERERERREMMERKNGDWVLLAFPQIFSHTDAHS